MQLKPPRGFQCTLSIKWGTINANATRRGSSAFPDIFLSTLHGFSPTSSNDISPNAEDMHLAYSEDIIFGACNSDRIVGLILQHVAKDSDIRMVHF